MQILPREHHFYAAVSKFLFQHPKHGIVLAQDPITLKDAEQYDLSPLMLYGLTVAGLPIRWITFSSVEQPRSLQNVLLEGWQSAEGLRGRPDLLRINRHLALSSPELLLAMEKIGVQVVIAGPKEKSLPASLRSAQESSRWLLMRFGSAAGTTIGTIQTLCQCAQYEHVGDLRLGGGRRDIEDKARHWLALPVQESRLVQANILDWEPGPWLASWESSLPPNPSRYFKSDWSYGGTWLMTGENAPEDTEDEDSWSDGSYDNSVEISKNLVSCWPNSPSEIAKCIGITLRELQWYLTGKASLEPQHQYKLRTLLGIQYDQRMEEYVGIGPYVLIAKKTKPLEDLYVAISNGGNARPCEIVPNQGAADPSWRYVFVNTYGQPPSVVMAPRGEKITDRLSSLLFNYEGLAPVSPGFYKEMVAACARACRKPTDNIRELANFLLPYEVHWANATWIPE